MDKNTRDTQFQGFAKLLWDELINANDGGYIDVNTDFDDGIDPTDYRGIIARRAYDLVDISICHIAMGMSNDSAVMFVPRRNAVSYIPDMTQWPQDQKCSE